MARLLFSQLAARFPTGMLAIGLLIHVEQRLGTYTAAGAVLAAFGISQGISGPLSGRLMSRFGMRGVLVPTTLVCAGALAIIALVPMSTPLTAATAFVAGLAVPPVQSAVRTVYPTLVRGPGLVGLFSIDATLQEVIWLIGPLATITVGALWNSTVTVLVAAGILLLGGLWFIAAEPIGTVRIPRSPRRMGAVLRNPVVVVMAVLLMLVLGLWGGIDAAAVAQYGHDSPITAALLAISAAGSFVGGMLTGHLPIRRTSLTVRILVAVLGVGFSTFVVANPVLLAVGVFIAGASCAPVVTVANASVSARVRFADTAEAFGWLATAIMLGASAASALAGVAIDHFGAVGGYYVAASFIGLALLISLTTMRVHPDLHHAELEPLAETGALSLG